LILIESPLNKIMANKNPQKVDEKEKKPQEQGQEKQPQGQEQESQQEPQEEKRKVGPLDPDFVIMFFFAFFFDALDLLLDGSTTISQIPIGKIIGVILDILTLIIIGGWLWYKSGSLGSTKKSTESLKKVGKKLGPVLKRMVPATLIEVGSGLGLGLTSWIGIFPSWTIAVLSVLL